MRTFHIGGTAQVAEQSFFELANDGIAATAARPTPWSVRTARAIVMSPTCSSPSRSMARTARPTSPPMARTCGPRTGKRARSSAANAWPTGTSTTPPTTVKSVKERELPEPDDEFAQLASEFDTIDELKASLTDQVKRVKRIQQAEQIRDKALETLLEQTEVPLPEKIVQAQIDDTLHNAIHGLDHDEDRFAEALAEQGSSRDEFDTDSRTNAERAVKTQLVMDAIADQLNVQVGQNDLSERLVLMSRQYGLEPQQLLQYLQENNQLPVMFADVRRGLTVAAVVHGATVADTDGNVIDTTEFFGPPADQETAAESAAETAAEVADASAEPADAEPEQAADEASADTEPEQADEASADTK